MDYSMFIDEKKAQFESGILNKRIASIKDIDEGHVKEIVEECRSRGFEYAISQVELQNVGLINEMLKEGFNIRGFPITLKKDIKVKQKTDRSIRKYQENDLVELKKISARAFTNAHWYNDKRLKKEDVNKIYLKWVENSCHGRAEAVFVWGKKGNILGYVACNKKNNCGVIDLIAVSKNSRGKGVGKLLVNAACSYFNKIGLKSVEVKTEAANIPALNLYTECGFRVSWVEVNINKWL